MVWWAHTAMVHCKQNGIQQMLKQECEADVQMEEIKTGVGGMQIELEQVWR